MALEIEGLDDLNRALMALKGEVLEAAIGGIYAGGLAIQAESQKNTPVEYGNLRGSAYTTKLRRAVEVGYTSSYALFVHENMEQKLRGQPRPSGLGAYWNPGGPKFLENAVKEKAQTVLGLVAAHVGRAIT